MRWLWTNLVVGLLTVSSCLSVAACRVRGEVAEGSSIPGAESLTQVSPAPPVETAGGSAEVEVFDFEGEAAGSPPSGFAALLSGQGRPGQWQVQEAADAPSGSRIVAQSDDDATSYRFPLLIRESRSARDLDLSIRFKPVSGSKDQGAGLVWRYRDPDNYYVVRANALEDNVVLYKMEGGKRSDLDLKGARNTYGLDVEVPRGEWGELRVEVVGELFKVFLNGQPLFEVEDGTFPDAGGVGLWTKADSVVWFDDLRLTVRDTASAPPG